MATANSNCWPGTNVPRTFASAFSSTPVDVHSMQITQNLRAGAAQGVETKKSRPGPRGPHFQSKAAQLRALLARGAMSTAQLAEASGFPKKHVPALLRQDLKVGHVILLRDSWPMLYVLADSYTLPKAGQ